MTSNDAWITDALDTYRLSDGAAKRIEDTFGPWADAAGLARPRIEPHPEESDIWQEALRDHRGRLERELSTARPETVITLGNAALRVLRELVGDAGPRRLAVAGYGTERVVRFNGRAIRWLPLAHPAAPAPYPAAHAAWASAVARRPPT